MFGKKPWKPGKPTKCAKSGFQGKFSASGQMRFNERNLSDKLQALKARTSCKDCGLIGHWAGDQACKSPSEETKRFLATGERPKPKPKAKFGKKSGGFLKKAGLALAGMLSLVSGLKAPIGPRDQIGPLEMLEEQLDEFLAKAWQSRKRGRDEDDTAAGSSGAGADDRVSKRRRVTRGKAATAVAASAASAAGAARSVKRRMCQATWGRVLPAVEPILQHVPAQLSSINFQARASLELVGAQASLSLRQVTELPAAIGKYAARETASCLTMHRWQQQQQRPVGRLAFPAFNTTACMSTYNSNRVVTAGVRSPVKRKPSRASAQPALRRRPAGRAAMAVPLVAAAVRALLRPVLPHARRQAQRRGPLRRPRPRPHPPRSR